VRVLVTGGTGYLGSAVVRALARRNDDVVVLTRHPPDVSIALPTDKVAHVAGDIRDRDAVARAARGADAIVHLAALVSVWRPRVRDFDDVNVTGLRHVLDVCRAQRISRLIYTSSFLALPPAGRDEPIRANDYQRTKVDALAVARAAAADGAPIVTLCPGVVYGPGAATEGNLVGRLVGDHVAGRLPGVIGGEHTWSFSYVDDVVTAHVEALRRATAGDELVIGGDNAPQMRLFEIVRERLGLSLPRRIPSGLAYAAGAFEEARARLTGRPPLLTRGVVTIFGHDWPLDGRPAADRLGYRITPLAEGMRSVVGVRAEGQSGGQSGV
jgi:nucleoside-diphosphate-sugar epimerase